MSRANRRFGQTLKRKNEQIFGRERSMVCIDSFDDAMRFIDFDVHASDDISLYAVQMNRWMERKFAMLRRSPKANVEMCVYYYDGLLELRDRQIEWLIKNYHMGLSVVLSIGVAMGYGLGNVYFNLILIETKLLNAMRCILLQLGEMCGVKDLSTVTPALIVGSNYDFSERQLKKLITPKLYRYESGLGERLRLPYKFIPEDLKYDPTNDLFALKHGLAIFPDREVRHYTQTELWLQWRHTADRFKFITEETSPFDHYIDCLLSATAELCRETWNEEDGILDMNVAYRQMSEIKGLDEKHFKEKIDINLKNDGSVKKESPYDQVKKDAGKEGTTLSVKNRYIGEICGMFVEIRKPTMKYHQVIQPYLRSTEHRDIITTSILMGLAQKTSWKKTGNWDRTDYQAICKAFNSACEMWIYTISKSITDLQFITATATLARKRILTAGAYEVHLFANNNFPTSDLKELEDEIYGRTKLVYIEDEWDKRRMPYFFGTQLPVCVKSVVVARLFRTVHIMHERELDWMASFYHDDTQTQFMLKKRMEDDRMPFLCHCGTSSFIRVYTSESKSVFYRFDEPSHACGFWLLIMIQNENMMFSNGLTNMNLYYCPVIVSEILKWVSDETPPKIKAMFEALRVSYASSGKSVLDNNMDKFTMDDRSLVDCDDIQKVYEELYSVGIDRV